VDERVRELVAAAPVARLGTLDRRLRPHLVPICFALERETLYTAVDRKPKRTRRLRRLQNVRDRPQVTVLVDHYEEDWSRLWWVMLRGQGRVLEDGEEWQRALDLLAAKYAQYRTERLDAAVIAVDVERWQLWRAA